MDEKAIVTLLTTGLDDIPSVIRKLSESVVASTPATKTEPHGYGPDETEDFVWTVWNAVFAAAGQASSEKQLHLIVEFLVQLSKVEVKDPATGEVLTRDGDKVWTDLPMFGWVTRDWFNFQPSLVEGEELARLERQVKMLAFLMAYPSDDGANDNSLYAFWALRDTFEENRPIASSAVRLAAPWMLYAAKYLWWHTEQGTELPARCGVPGEKYAEKEWRGFNKERWAVWRDGFVAAQAEVKDEEVKTMAGRAAEIMKELEG